MNIDVIPDITMRGQDDPHGRAVAAHPPTIGQLAAQLWDLAGRPADWWNLITFDPAEPSRVWLASQSAGRVEGQVEGQVKGRLRGAGVWLTTWPPGHRTDVHDHIDTEVSTMIAGELVEVTMSADGVAERPLRTNRVRVHGGGHTHELHNPGPSFAITLHASTSPPS
jgi:hypothetical protein